MAVLFIKKVSATVGKCLAYASHDKVEPITKDDIADVINYARNDKAGTVTFKTLTTSLNCPSMGQGTLGDFNELIQKFSKVKSKRRNIKSQGTPALAFHLVQSFEKGTTPLLANQIGLETAEKLFGDKYRVQISTHTNTENIHNHIVFCAWGEDGKKWHDCHASMREMRQVSDAICQEHGLAILEATKDYKLAKKEVEQGKYRYYKPTDRKNQMLQKRDSHEVTNANINGYRNSTGYNRFEQKAENKRDIICNDISILLPFATDYEHLLELLQVQAGYEIKSRKKNGDWLEHIAFKPPSAERFIRDTSLADGFYTRENLSRIISERQEYKIVVPTSENERDEMSDIVIMNSYKYGDVDVSRLSEKVKAMHSSNGEERIYRERGEADSKIVIAIKHHDKELHDALFSGGYDSSIIDRIIREIQIGERMEKYKMRQEQEAKLQQSVKQIQNLLDGLKYIERMPTQDIDQVNKLLVLKRLEQQSTKDNIARIRLGLYEVKEKLELLLELKEIQNRMALKKEDPDYQEYELEADRQRARACVDKLKKNYPVTDGDIIEAERNVQLLKRKIDKLNKRLHRLERGLDGMRAYESAIRSCETDVCDSALENTVINTKRDVADLQPEQHTKEKKRKKAQRER